MAIDKQARFERLPRWAKDEIEALRKTIEEQATHIAKLSMLSGATNVRVSGSHVHPDIMLPSNSMIDFYLPDDRPEQIVPNTISVRHWGDRRDSLYVSSDGGTLLIKPQATNCFVVHGGKF